MLCLFFIYIQLGMIQQKELTAGHPTLYFCYKFKPLFNSLRYFIVKVKILQSFYEKLLIIIPPCMFLQKKMKSIFFIYFYSVCDFVCLFITSEDILSGCNGQHEDLA